MKIRLRCCCIPKGAILGPAFSPWEMWTSRLQPWRHTVSFCAMLCAVTFLLLAMAYVEVDSSVPNIFPPDHNQNGGSLVFANFESWTSAFAETDQPVPTLADVCDPLNFASSSRCPIFWCEVSPVTEVPTLDEGSCRCVRKETATGCGEDSTLTAKVRFMGSEDWLTTSNLEESIGDHMVDELLSPGLAFYGGSRGSSVRVTSNLAPSMLEEWETAEYMTSPFKEVDYQLSREDTSVASCGWEELCFCGTTSCLTLDGWSSAGTIELSRRHLSRNESIEPGQGRRLQTYVPVYRAEQRISVNVVFGIDTASDSPLLGERDASELWSFLSTFDPKMPWAQRNMMTFCSTLPAELVVVEKYCWIEVFSNWLSSRGVRFPVQSSLFHPYVDSFKSSTLTGATSSGDYLWTRNWELLACFMIFKVDFSKNSQTDAGLLYKAKWDAQLDYFNAAAEPVTKGAFHSSGDWVRLDAQRELVSSTVSTLVIVLCLAFIGMLMFTFNMILSIYVVIGTVQVVCGLGFFIICAMQWALGPVEVIAFIVFIGYAVTYSLHIAHKYGDPGAEADPLRDDLEEEAALRYRRTAFALRSLGGAALGSGMTTVGSSTFLLFCQLTIFNKLGGVVLAVTLWSVATALMTLAAALLMGGPTKPGCIGRGRPRCPPLPNCELFYSVGDAFRRSRYSGAVLFQSDASAPTVRPTDVEEVDEDQIADLATDIGGDIGTEVSLEPIWVREVDHATTTRILQGTQPTSPISDGSDGREGTFRL